MCERAKRLAWVVTVVERHCACAIHWLAADLVIAVYEYVSLYEMPSVSLEIVISQLPLCTEALIWLT